MKHFIISLAAILLFTSVSFAQAEDSAGSCEVVNEKALALINQYKTLRDKRRQLPPGTYDKDLTADGGKLSKVLSELGARLGHPPYTKQNITGCLGDADAVKNHRQMGNFLDIYHRELKKAGRKIEKESNRQYLIYFWRGWHDFLFFISEDGVIVNHGWWFAYE